MGILKWEFWSDSKPTNIALLYRFRIPRREILSLEMQPEWTSSLKQLPWDKSLLIPEFIPIWQKKKEFGEIPQGLEWRVATESEPEYSVSWHGLDLLPCPFTGEEPLVSYSGSRILCPPYEATIISIQTTMVAQISWTNAKQLRDAWNTRYDHHLPAIQKPVWKKSNREITAIEKLLFNK